MKKRTKTEREAQLRRIRDALELIDRELARLRTQRDEKKAS